VNAVATDEPGAAVAGSGEHPDALALNNITVRFGGIVAVDSVSLRVRRGESVGLIGPNGAGKTTLLDVAAGVRRPRDGTVLLFGEPATRTSAVRRARSGVGRTFQHLSLFEGMTVREHVVIGYLAGTAHERPLRGSLARRSRLESEAMADDSPFAPTALITRLGLDAVADELAGEQSVGVARMVDLARALAMRPRVLLLDEPVSGLAESEPEEVASLLRTLRAEHQLSMLIVEHNLEFARMVSDRLVALDFGKKIADGPPAEVLGSDDVRRAYFGADADTEAAVQHLGPSG
jgi:branched-chain amino acid transport system ATP-binding protein